MAKRWTYDKAGNVVAIETGSTAMLTQGKGYKITAGYYLSNPQAFTKEPVPTAAITPPTGVSLPATEPGDPLNTTYLITTQTYNRLGQPIEVIDGNGNRTGYGYDAKNRLEAVTQYLSSGNLVTQYGYDNNGNRTLVTDARSKSAHVAYDGLNRPWRMTDTRGIVTTEYRYDASGNLSQKIEPRTLDSTSFTGYTNYTYDLMHRLTGVGNDRSNGSTNYRTADVTYAYDGADRRVYMRDGYGPNHYRYTQGGQLHEEQDLWGAVNYGFDPNGKLITMVSGIGTIACAYDAGDRLATVSDYIGYSSGPWVSTYSYDANYGQLTKVAIPLSGGDQRLERTDQYFTLSDGKATNRLQVRKHLSYTPYLMWSTEFKYTYDLVGMVRTQNIGESGSTKIHTYTYDQASRLTQVDSTGAGTLSPLWYNHDEAGNLTTWRTLLSGSLRDYSQTVDDANRVTQLVSTSSTKDFSYAENGDLLSESFPGGGSWCSSTYGGWSTTYVHDDAGNLINRRELTNMVAGTWKKTSYSYDGNGRRLTQKYEDNPCSVYDKITRTHVYQYANGEVQAERVYGNAMTIYVRDPGGKILYQKNSAYNLRPNPYVLDHLGSVTQVRDYTGSLNRYTYDPYGNTASASSTVRNSFTFAGYQQDEGVDYYYLKARNYQPQMGRFLTQDTWKGDPWQPWTQNLYVYVGNNPVNYVDPTGHVAWAVVGGAVGGVVGGGIAAYSTWNQTGSVEWGTVAAGAVGGALVGSGLGFLAAEGTVAAGYVLDKAGLMHAGGVATSAGLAGMGTTTATVAANTAAHERYKMQLRQQMAAPHVQDKRLAKVMSELYRTNATVGSGSTADAIRYERATQQPVGGAFIL